MKTGIQKLKLHTKYEMLLFFALCTYQFKAGGGGGRQGMGLDCDCCDLAFPGEGIFESVFARRGDI